MENCPLRVSFFLWFWTYFQGSGFIAYGVILAILLLVGESWVRRSGRSPDWWDSWVILLWVRASRCAAMQRDALADRAVHGKGIGACQKRVCSDFAVS